MTYSFDRMDDLISVVVPIFNQEQYLPRCLASLRRQTYANLEIILVDDGSTDGSSQMCDKYALEDSRCVVIHKENGGTGSARNAGHDVATGDWLLFIDADDYFNLDMIRLMHRAAISHPDTDLVMVNGARTTIQEESITPFLDSDIPSAVLMSQKELMEGITSRNSLMFVVEWNKLYRRELIEHVRQCSFGIGEDFDFNLNVFLKSRKCVYLAQTLYWWYQNPKSATHSADYLSLYFNCRLKILTRHLQSLSEDEQCFEGLILRRLFRDLALFSGWQYRRKLETTALETRTLVKIVQKRHLKHYRMRNDIGLLEKLGCLMMLKSPFFAHKIMKMTKNV